MLTIDLPGAEYYDPAKEEFSYEKERVLHLEHSLYSMSLWESKWKKPFLNSDKTQAEMADYLCCMCDEPISAEEIQRIAIADWQRMEAYLKDPMTATTFGKDKNATSRRKKFTTEEIYYLMAVHNIPFDCDRWPFNRLMTLLRIAAIRSGPQKKVGKKDILRHQAELNAARRAKLGSKG